MKKWGMFFSLLIFSLHAYELSLCAIFKNEAPYLKEWIDFHKTVGVEHFYLYNNNSTDHYEEVLKPYIEAGEVELIPWNYSYTHYSQWFGILCASFTDAAKRSAGITTWLIVIDTDEFIFPVEKDSLLELLTDFEDQVALCVNWQLYGTSHVPCILPGERMLEKLTLRAPTDYLWNKHVKTIVRPEYVVHFTNPHFPILKAGFRQVTENCEPFFGCFSPSISVKKIRINHYWTRDEHFFFTNKLPRQKTCAYQSQEQLMQDAMYLNEVHDPCILRWNMPPLEDEN